MATGKRRGTEWGGSTKAASERKAAGCLFGLAFGDALGAPTEFLTLLEIHERFPPTGPSELVGNPARVTDDTQMALAVGEALLAATNGPVGHGRDRDWRWPGAVMAGETLPPLTADRVEGPLRKAFVAWLRSPDNDRAPGSTCLRACANLDRGLPWYQATVAASKGCGANMRVAPVGLLPLGEGEAAQRVRAALAQFQAALTHGHPTALAASDLTAYTVADLAAGGETLSLSSRLRAYAASQRHVYHADWLGPLWQRPGVASPADFMARGWDECLAALDRLEAALRNPDPGQDPCLSTGDGWVAEEALATGLLCFLLFPQDGVAAVHRAAVTRGDSDSIAALAGAFAGAHLGLAAWPLAWINRIEYRQRLERLALAWD